MQAWLEVLYTLLQVKPYKNIDIFCAKSFNFISFMIICHYWYNIVQYQRPACTSRWMRCLDIRARGYWFEPSPEWVMLFLTKKKKACYLYLKCVSCQFLPENEFVQVITRKNMVRIEGWCYSREILTKWHITL